VHVHRANILLWQIKQLVHSGIQAGILPILPIDSAHDISLYTRLLGTTHAMTDYQIRT